MDLSKLQLKTKNKASKRKGRGTGIGNGKTAGRGNKGAGQRAGKKLPYIGFRGGTLPFLRLIPKRGFTPPCRRIYQIVNLCDIATKLKGVASVTPQALHNVGLINEVRKPVKILAKNKGGFKDNVTIRADKFSAQAKEIIEKAGGKAEIVDRTQSEPAKDGGE